MLSLDEPATYVEFCNGSVSVYDDIGALPVFLKPISYLITVPGITDQLKILLVTIKSVID